MPAKPRIVWSPSAINHFSSWIQYIAKDSSKTAEKERQKILKTVARLEPFPLSGRIVPEFNSPTLREVIHGSIRIIYEVQGKVAHVLAFHHARRQMDLMLFA